MLNDRLLLLAHTGATLAMVGVMWSVQLVIYPAFRSVTDGNFVSYVTIHSTRIVYVLALFAPLEVLLALALWLNPPNGVSRSLAVVAGAVLALMWVATGLYYGPFHGRLTADGGRPDLVGQLITTNWARTIGWSIRGALALLMLNQALVATTDAAS